MSKIVVYQTNTFLGMEYANNFARYCYEQEISPIRWTLAEATQEGLKELMRLHSEDICRYRDELLATLNSSLCFYSN